MYLTSYSKLVIWLFQAVPALTVLAEHRFNRDLRSLATAALTMIVEFDGSMCGVGVIWYRVVRDAVGARMVPLGRALRWTFAG